MHVALVEKALHASTIVYYEPKSDLWVQVSPTVLGNSKKALGELVVQSWSPGLLM
jgi:hypothetical protein